MNAAPTRWPPDMPLLTRRRLLTGLIAAPFVVTTPGLLMKVKAPLILAPAITADMLQNAMLAGIRLSGVGEPVGVVVDYLLADGRIARRWENRPNWAHERRDGPILDVTAEYGGPIRQRFVEVGPGIGHYDWVRA